MAVHYDLCIISSVKKLLYWQCFISSVHIIICFYHTMHMYRGRSVYMPQLKPVSFQVFVYMWSEFMLAHNAGRCTNPVLARHLYYTMCVHTDEKIEFMSLLYSVAFMQQAATLRNIFNWGPVGYFIMNRI